MALFQFGRKIDLSKEYSLEEIPIFSTLNPSEHKIIEKKARLVEYKRGDIVFQEGTVSEAFYVVISGRFRLFALSKGVGTSQTLLFFYRGDHFGETSLLTGRMHSATVEAKSDGLLLKIEKDEFLKLVKEIPAISLHLSRTLGHRLTKSEDIGRRREVKIASLYNQTDPEEGFNFWLEFASSVVQETKRKIIVVDFVSPIAALFREKFQTNIKSFDLQGIELTRENEIRECLFEHPSGFHYLHVQADGLEEKDEKKIPALLTFLTYRYDYLMLRLPNQIGHPSFRTLKQSDLVYVYCRPESQELAQCAKTVQDFINSYGFSKIEVKIIVTEKNIKKAISLEEKERILGFRIFSLLPDQDHNRDRYNTILRFLSKEWAGTLVGLALGSGAAYGLAHIGVLRVLEKENISVDVIAGSSIGALVGGIWAAGYNSDELEALAKSIDKRTGFFKVLGFRDLSVAHRGFFKGNQVSRFLKSYLGDKTFQDLKIPVRIIATNLFTSEEVIFESGSVVDAIRASIAIPGIFRPLHYKGSYLIDGGVIDPLPVKVLRQMGVKKIIAVNVLSSPSDRVERNRLLKEVRREKLKALAQKGLWSKMLAGFLERIRERYADNIFNVIMNTIQFMEYEMAETWGSESDVLIHPIVFEGHWAQFYEPEKFIKVGEDKTREQLAEIKRLLVE